MESRITLIPGDGIGPEIVREAVKVLDSVADKYGHKFDYTKIPMIGFLTCKLSFFTRYAENGFTFPVNPLPACFFFRYRIFYSTS